LLAITARSATNPIPPEKFEEIHGRIEAKERERDQEAERRLREHVAAEKSQAEAKAKAEIEAIRKQAASTLEKAKQDAAEKEAAARKAAEAAAAVKVAEHEQARKAAEERAKEQSVAAEKAKHEAAVREATVRQEARKAAEVASAQKIAEVEKARSAAEQKAKEHAEALERLKRESIAKENAVREDARKQAEVALGPKLAEAEQARKVAEEKLQAAKVAQETQLSLRLKEQREALEKDKANTVNEKRVKFFKEKLKLEEQLQAARRRVQEKTAEELGEGAEVDLFEALKAQFDGDKIRRIERGTAGADIIHEVMHNGKVCGTIVYDSKNRNQWRWDYVTKLRQDQLAAKAEHAILSTAVFPAGTRQVHLHEGVLVANPARVIVLVELMRKHIVRTYGLRVSNEAREQKMGKLYEFVTSIDRITGPASEDDR